MSLPAGYSQPQNDISRVSDKNKTKSVTFIEQNNFLFHTKNNHSS